MQKDIPITRWKESRISEAWCGKVFPTPILVVGNNVGGKVGKVQQVIEDRVRIAESTASKHIVAVQVSEVKQVIKEEMLAAGQAIVYSEPERQVMSRSGDVCVVALTDQWYINYGEDEWRDATRHAPA